MKKHLDFDYINGNAIIFFGKKINRTRHRHNGNTFAYCAKLLLSDGPPIKVELLKRGRYADEMHGTYYRMWFAQYLLEVNDALVKAGFKTRIKQ